MGSQRVGHNWVTDVIWIGIWPPVERYWGEGDNWKTLWKLPTQWKEINLLCSTTLNLDALIVLFSVFNQRSLKSSLVKKYPWVVEGHSSQTEKYLGWGLPLNFLSTQTSYSSDYFFRKEKTEDIYTFLSIQIEANPSYIPDICIFSPKQLFVLFSRRAFPVSYFQQALKSSVIFLFAQ